MHRWFITVLFVGLCFLAGQMALGLPQESSDPNLMQDDEMSGVIELSENFDLELKRQQKLFEQLVVQLKDGFTPKKFESEKR